MHAGLVGRAPSLPPVARYAAGDDVFPVLASPMSDRHHMIEGELARRILVAAVLARVVVARIDVRPRKRYVVEPAFDFDVAKKADDRRQFDAEGNRTYLTVVDRNHLHLPLAKQGNSLLPVNNLQWLVGGVE